MLDVKYDKIIEASKDSGQPIQEITEKFHKIYNDDMQNLGVNKPDVQPKATDYINEMIEMIESLVKKRVAYVADKHVLFSVEKYKHLWRIIQKDKGKNRLLEVGLRWQVTKNSSGFYFVETQQKLTNLVGTLHGEKEDLVGILNVVLCQKNA